MLHSASTKRTWELWPQLGYNSVKIFCAYHNGPFWFQLPFFTPYLTTKFPDWLLLSVILRAETCFETGQPRRLTGCPNAHSTDSHVLRTFPDYTCFSRPKPDYIWWILVKHNSLLTASSLILFQNCSKIIRNYAKTVGEYHLTDFLRFHLHRLETWFISLGYVGEHAL